MLYILWMSDKMRKQLSEKLIMLVEQLKNANSIFQVYDIQRRILLEILYYIYEKDIPENLEKIIILTKTAIDGMLEKRNSDIHIDEKLLKELYFRVRSWLACLDNIIGMSKSDLEEALLLAILMPMLPYYNYLCLTRKDISSFPPYCCDSCKYGKNKECPFSTSTYKTFQTLRRELIESLLDLTKLKRGCIKYAN